MEYNSQSLDLEQLPKENSNGTKHVDSKSLNPAQLLGMLSLGNAQGIKSIGSSISTTEVQFDSDASNGKEIFCASPYCSPSASPRVSSTRKSTTISRNEAPSVKCLSPYSKPDDRIASIKRPLRAQIIEISQFQPQSSTDAQSNHCLNNDINSKIQSTMNIYDSSPDKPVPICIVPLYEIINASQNKRSAVTYGNSSTSQSLPIMTYEIDNDRLNSINQKEKDTDSQKHDITTNGKNHSPAKQSDANKSQPVVESSATLFEASLCEDILLENSKSLKDTSFQDSLESSLELEGKDNFNRTNGMRKIFRILNFLRALAIAIYGFMLASKQLQNPDIIALGAKNLLITSIVSASLDVIVALIRLFPQYFWCFWDVKNWDPVR